MTDKIKFIGIQIEIGGKKVTLSMSEAKGLYNELDDLFGKPVTVPPPVPYNPFDKIGGPYGPTWCGTVPDAYTGVRSLSPDDQGKIVTQLFDCEGA